MLRTFLRLVQDDRVTIKRLNSLRVKLLDNCQWRCFFCHKEGRSHVGMMRCDSQFETALMRFQREFGMREVHFTGGEPTLHPALPEFIALATKLGYEAKITTNGQINKGSWEELATAGLSGVNLSIHTLNPNQLAGIQRPPQTRQWAINQIKHQVDSISFLRNNLPGINIQVNTVVGKQYYSALLVANYCRENEVSWRPMNDIYAREVAYSNLATLVKRLKGSCKWAILYQNSSACSICVDTDNGFKFRVKLIRCYRLPSICSNCPVYINGRCQEYIYGPRLETLSGELFVRLCIHRNGFPCVIRLGHFFNSEVFNELQENKSLQGVYTDVGPNHPSGN